MVFYILRVKLEVLPEVLCIYYRNVV